MSLTLAQLAPVLTLAFSAEMYDAFAKDHVLLSLLPHQKDGISEIGKEVAWPIKFSGRTENASNTGTYTEGDESTHDRRLARLPIVQYHEFAGISGLAAAISAQRVYADPTRAGFHGNGMGPLMGDVYDAAATLGMRLNRDAYIGNHNPASGHIGVAGAVTAHTLGDGPLAADNHTFAGIRAVGGGNPLLDPTEWQTAADTHALADLDLAAIRGKLLTPCMNRNKDRAPDFMTCNRQTFDAVVGLFDSTATSEFRRQEWLRGIGVKETINVGLSGINIQGIPLLVDRHAPANQIHSWYRDGTQWAFVSPVPALIGDMSEARAMLSALLGEDVSDEREIRALLTEATNRFAPGIEAIPTTADGSRVRVKAYCQLRHNRQAHGILTLT